MCRLGLSRLMGSLAELAGRAFQVRTWLGHGTFEMSSFAEQVSQTFDVTRLLRRDFRTGPGQNRRRRRCHRVEG